VGPATSSVMADSQIAAIGLMILLGTGGTEAAGAFS
jgi:hypothetical protein